MCSISEYQEGCTALLPQLTSCIPVIRLMLPVACAQGFDSCQFYVSRCCHWSRQLLRGVCHVAGTVTTSISLPGCIANPGLCSKRYQKPQSIASTPGINVEYQEQGQSHSAAVNTKVEGTLILPLEAASPVPNVSHYVGHLHHCMMPLSLAFLIKRA